MSLSALTVLALSVTLFVVLQEGFGLPVSGTSPASAQSSSRHVRTKRCSCNSWLDKECIYFCHLDIIWVNTPSKIIPYGLGSPLSRRRRRSPGRCACSSPVDTDCSGFCHQSLENPSKVVGPMEEAGSHSDTHSNNLLASLRSVIQSNNKAFPVLAAASRKRPSRVARHKIRYRRAGDRGAQRAQRAST